MVDNLQPQHANVITLTTHWSTPQITHHVVDSAPSLKSKKNTSCEELAIKTIASYQANLTKRRAVRVNLNDTFKSWSEAEYTAE